MYSKQVMQLFLNTENSGQIRSADGTGQIEDEACGSVIKVFLQVENDIVKEAKYKTFGCPVSIAASELICRMIKDKTIIEILNIVDEELYVYLGELPVDKLRCVVSAKQAVLDAIANYQKKKTRKAKV
jgi:nitrogen fixation protein NifU and related proteins